MSNLYIDNYYDNDFLINLSKSIDADTGNGAKVQEFLDERKIDFSHDLAILEKATKVGPDFDIRYAGGAYKIESNAAVGSELLVQCVDRKIFVDGVAVSSQKNQDGRISFTTANNDVFEVTFDCIVGQGVTVDPSERSFTGHVKPANAPEASPVTGKIYYPWEQLLSEDDSAPGTADEKELQYEENGRDTEALKHLAVALDLVRNPSDILIHDGGDDAGPVHDTPMPRALNMRFMASPAVEHNEAPANHDSEKKSWFRKSKLTEHILNVTPAMITSVVSVGLTAALAPGTIVAMGIGASTAAISYGGFQLIKKVRKVDQKKLTKWVVSKVQDSFKEELLKDILKHAAEQAVNAPEAESRDNDNLAIITKDKFNEALEELIRAGVRGDAKKKFGLLFYFGKNEFEKGFDKGVKDWIAKRCPEAITLDRAREQIRIIKMVNASLTSTRSIESLKSEMEQLEQERQELLLEKEGDIVLPVDVTARETRIKDLNRGFHDEMGRLTDFLNKGDLANAEKSLQGLRGKMNELREVHGEEPYPGHEKPIVEHRG